MIIILAYWPKGIFTIWSKYWFIIRWSVLRCLVCSGRGRFRASSICLQRTGSVRLLVWWLHFPVSWYYVGLTWKWWKKFWTVRKSGRYYRWPFVISSVRGLPPLSGGLCIDIRAKSSISFVWASVEWIFWCRLHRYGSLLYWFFRLLLLCLSGCFTIKMRVIVLPESSLPIIRRWKRYTDKRKKKFPRSVMISPTIWMLWRQCALIRMAWTFWGG